jgi:hypothetical protein
MSLIIKKNTTFKIPRTGSGAPSGIVAATAGNLIINFALFSGEVYIKANNTLWSFFFGEGNSEYQRLQWNGFIPNTWTLDVNNGDTVATNPSTNSAVIPTTGWIYTVGDGPAVTIAVAPTGIPVATETIIVSSNTSFNGTFTNTVPNIFWSDGIDSGLEFNATWRFRNAETNAELNNPSSDANYIPTTGWTENGSPIAITITAA